MPGRELWGLGVSVLACAPLSRSLFHTNTHTHSLTPTQTHRCEHLCMSRHDANVDGVRPVCVCVCVCVCLTCMHPIRYTRAHMAEA